MLILPESGCVAIANQHRQQLRPAQPTYRHEQCPPYLQMGTPVPHATKHICARICARCDAQIPCRSSALTQLIMATPTQFAVRVALRESVYVGVTPPGTNERSDVTVTTKLGSFARLANCEFLSSWVSFETTSLSTARLDNAGHVFSLYPACRCRQLISAADVKLAIPNEALH